MNLYDLGLAPWVEEQFAPFAAQGLTLGRVALEHKHLYRIYTADGDLLGEVSGKLRHEAQGRQHFPAVGDWVAVSPRLSEQRATIHAVLPRQTKFSRKLAGQTTEEQIVAANLDTVFLVNALNHDFNVRRLERYLILAWESGAAPVIILSKADLCAGPTEQELRIRETEAVALGVPVLAISAARNEGMEQLLPYLHKGQTVGLLGSSGAGKSSIVNRLAGRALQAVQEVRHGDDRGRHTTTSRELFVLPQGAVMIDTPGMRELQLWDAEQGLSDSFQDIEEWARQCFFHDCTHRREPNCAVKEALRSGALPQARYDNYLKTQRELAFLARKEEGKLRLMEKEKWKKLSAQQAKYEYD